jgi:hypothetical protein
MAGVLNILESLKNIEAQTRVVSWVAVRLGLNSAFASKTTKIEEPRLMAPTDLETQLREGTVNTAVTKLGANSCRTLLVAAAAYLVLYRGKEKFTRDELISCAREARMWKSDYGVQTSVNVIRMCDAGELIEKSKDVFDLSQKKLAELEGKLSEQ